MYIEIRTPKRKKCEHFDTLCGRKYGDGAVASAMDLDIHDVNAADKWRKLLNAWTNYTLATELDTKPQPVQVATLLTVIGEDSREVYSTFKDWAADGDARRIILITTLNIYTLTEYTA